MEVNLNLQYRAINHLRSYNQLQTQFLGENTYIDQYLHGSYYCLAFYEISVLTYYCTNIISNILLILKPVLIVATDKFPAWESGSIFNQQ